MELTIHLQMDRDLKYMELYLHYTICLYDVAIS
jgi:hypothetical protein